MSGLSKDLVIGALPAGVGLTLSLVNSALGTVSLIVGIAYALWRWRREARAPLPSPHENQK